MASVVVNGIVSEGPGAESVPDTEPQPELVIGLLAAPGPASELTDRLVGHILGDLAQAEGAAGRLPLAEAVTRRMGELGARTERGEHGAGFVARVITGNIWLLLGMLRANRPWQLALRLMRMLAVAFAAGGVSAGVSGLLRAPPFFRAARPG